MRNVCASALSLLICAATVPAGEAPAPDKPEAREAFVEQMKAALREAGVKGEMPFDPEQFVLTVGETRFFLLNAYEDYCAADALKRVRIVERYAHLIHEPKTDLPETYAEASKHLLPSLRSRIYLEDAQLRTREESFPALVLHEHLVVMLSFDAPETMSMVGAGQLAAWKTDYDTALKKACANLDEQSKRPLRELAEGLWIGPWQDSYDASRILLTGMFEDYEIKGDLLAVVPNRDVLLLSGTEEQAGLVNLLKAAGRALEMPRPLSGIVLRLKDGKWSPWLPPEDHELYDGFRELMLLDLKAAYAQQAARAATEYADNLEDVRLGELVVGKDKRTGRVQSFAVWTKGETSDLPQADWVLFVDLDRPKEQGPVAEASWARAQEVLGAKMKKLDTYPLRFRVAEFPSPAELNKLKGE